jgi:precorrin-2/cobalt-factor-2 C20-methyltransferase
MTLKAVRIISEVKVVAYLAPNEGESSARAIAAPHLSGKQEIAIRVPMRPGVVPAEIYDSAAETIAEFLGSGQDVAVLCEGDPFFYGSFAYLHKRLAHRFQAVVIPGVSSLNACAAAAGRPLVSRDETLTVLPATLADAEFSKRLGDGGALAIMKIGRHFSRIRKHLADSGRAASAVYVAHGTRPDEVVAPLESLGEIEAPYFSMLLVRAR